MRPDWNLANDDRLESYPNIYKLSNEISITFRGEW
jgi:hypothetical protein